MKQHEYHVIGVMSGTSLDGIDLVYAKFTYTDVWTFSILESETVAYNAFWTDTLKRLVDVSADELSQIDAAYTTHLGEIILRFIKAKAITVLDAVCSHGHTALHNPNAGFTYQIGNMEHIANLINCKVVCDFRPQDVALGGQGAPLVPIGDRLLFGAYHFCLNLGGFANISLEDNHTRIAYDVCPVNIVLNHYTNTLGLAYDKGGQMAAKGSINASLLEALNALEYYSEKAPKSLGLEWVKSTVLPLITTYDLGVNDILKTFCEHVAVQISAAIKKKTKVSVCVTGGGAYNTYLMSRITAHTKHNIVIPEATIVEFKEALIFGLLGVLKLRNEVNCLKSVTGASKNHSSGVVFKP